MIINLNQKLNNLEIKIHQVFKKNNPINFYYLNYKIIVKENNLENKDEIIIFKIL